MEFLAQEVLIEAISKLAALSNSKLFLLLEDSSANRSFAGEEELCAAFSSGTLVRRENDARVHYDVEDRRCIKTAGVAWAKGGGGVGVIGGNGQELPPVAADGSAVISAFNDEGATRSLFPSDCDSQSGSLMGDPLGFVDVGRNQGAQVEGKGKRVGRVDKSLLRPSDDSGQGALRGGIPGLQGNIPGLSQGDFRGASEESASQRRRAEDLIPALGPDPTPSAETRQKRGGSRGAENADREAMNKRIKMEPRSRSPSPPESAPPPATEPNVPSLPSISFDALQEKILKDTTLMSTLSSALKSLSHLPSSSSSIPPPVSSSTFFPPSAPSSNPQSKANTTRETSSPLSAAPQSSLFPSPRARDDVDQHYPASSTASLFPSSDPPSATTKSPVTTPAPSPSRPAAPASSASASPAVSLYSSDATRAIRVKNPNYADPVSVSARFARFGDVLFVSRCGENLQSPVAAAAAASAAAAGWWTIEFDTVRAAADALLYAREQRGLEAHFEENHEFTDCLWVAYEPEGKMEGTEAERSVIEFLRENFSFLGKILRTSRVKFVVEEKEASAVLQFRSTKHVEMIIQKVRGQKLSGTRFQMDVASPLLKDKYFLPQTGGGGGGIVGGSVKAPKPPVYAVVAPASGERAPRSSTPSSDDGRRSNGARSNERVDQQPQKQQRQKKQSRQLQQQQQHDQRVESPLTNPENPRFASSDRGNSSAATLIATSSAVPATSSTVPATSSKSNSPSPEDRKSRSIKLVLNEKQLTILKKCPVEKLVELFTSYGSVVEVFMPTATRPSFGVEFLDVTAANKAVMAGAASSGAFKAVFDLDASFSSSSSSPGLWMGGLEMSPSCSASSLRRGLIERFAKFDPRPAYIWLARSKSQTVIKFSTPEIANRVFEDLKGDKTQKFDFDLISEKGIQLFVDRLTNEDATDNPQ